MNKIVIAHPQLVEAPARMETLMAHARFNPSGEKQCMPLIAPSATGKSTIVREFVKKKNIPEALEQGLIPALHVTLKTSTSKKSIVQDILFKLAEISGRETHPDRGSENVLLERAHIYMRQAKIEIMFIDEFHHVLLSDTEKTAYAVGETVKWMLINGSCPIVLSGTQKAWGPFRSNEQLVRRSIAGVDLSPLSASRAEDREVFGRFFGKYLSDMEVLGIVKNAQMFAVGEVFSCLMQASGGVFGLGCKLLVEAVRHMTHDGRDALSNDDLIRASDALVLSQDGKGGNPFRDGVRGMKISEAA